MSASGWFCLQHGMSTRRGVGFDRAGSAAENTLGRLREGRHDDTNRHHTIQSRLAALEGWVIL